MEDPGAKSIVGLIDHTLLKPYASKRDIESLVSDAHRFGTYSVCINPVYAKYAKELISKKRYDLKIAAVADFPLGSCSTMQRRSMIRPLAGTADEIDAVVQVGLVKSGNFSAVLEDLRGLAEEAHAGGMKLKVITEDAYLTVAEKEKVYETVFMSGADFIKTSTGFADSAYASSIGNGSTGAETESVRLMHDVAERLGKSDVGIKVAGGVKTYAQILELLEASGRDPIPERFRVGASGTKSICEEAGIKR